MGSRYASANRRPRSRAPRFWRRSLLTFWTKWSEGPLTAGEIETATRRFKNALIERALGEEMCGAGVSPDLISAVTDAVVAEVTALKSSITLHTRIS